MQSKTIQIVQNTRGASLIIALGLVFVLTILAAGVANLVGVFTLTTGQAERANIAYFAAEAGVEQALYDLIAYKDGYIANPNDSICGPAPETVDLFDLALSYDSPCQGTDVYRLAEFSDAAISAEERRGFWQIFHRALPDQAAAGNPYTIPNPFFTTNDNPAENKDGILQMSEWGRLTKSHPLSLSLLIDNGDATETDPADRFTYLPFDTTTKKVVFFADPAESGTLDWSTHDPSDSVQPNSRTWSQEDVFSWTLSAVDGNSEEYTLQGVVWESDFAECDEAGEYAIGGDYDCFILDLAEANVLPGLLGDPLLGEDINKNLAAATAVANSFNRVAAIAEDHSRATIPNYIEEMNDRLNGLDEDIRWRDVRLTINLIGTLSETSGLPSDSLRYKVVSAAPLADEYVYIVSEGFAGTVKQTIETRFRRQATIPIFQYVIVQH